MRLILEKILKRKWSIIVLLLVIGLGYAGVTMYSDKSKPASTVKTFKVERGDIEAQVSATGTISPVNSVDVSSKINGLINKVNVEENQQVEAGQILMVLDDKSLKAQVDQASARLVTAKLHYDRQNRLFASGAASRSELDVAQMEYDVAQAVYDNAVSSLDDTVIRAPLSGVIIGKPIPEGQTVAPGISTPMILMTIADMSKMQIETKIDESDIGKIKLGQKVVFTVDAYPGKDFTGTVSKISQKATTEQNVVYYPVMIDIEDHSGLLLPTMTARVTVVVGFSKNTLQIPLAVVRESKGQKVVQVLKNNDQTESVPIVTGLSTDEKVEVLEGLKEGDLIVSQSSKSSTAAKSTGGMFGGPPR